MTDPVLGTRSVVLGRSRRAGTSRLLEASIGADGRLRIDGQDLGRDVAGLFGSGLSEYEWSWTIAAADVTAALAALGASSDADPLAALAAWAAQHPGEDPGRALREAGVAVAFWNRVGD